MSKMFSFLCIPLSVINKILFLTFHIWVFVSTLEFLICVGAIDVSVRIITFKSWMPRSFNVQLSMYLKFIYVHIVQPPVWSNTVGVTLPNTCYVLYTFLANIFSLLKNVQFPSLFDGIPSLIWHGVKINLKQFGDLSYLTLSWNLYPTVYLYVNIASKTMSNSKYQYYMCPFLCCPRERYWYMLQMLKCLVGWICVLGMQCILLLVILSHLGINVWFIFLLYRFHS